MKNSLAAQIYKFLLCKTNTHQFDLATGPCNRTARKTKTEIRLIIYGEGPWCRHRENIAGLVAKRAPQSNINISSTVTLFERVNCRRVTDMHRMTSTCARHGQSIRELMHITNTLVKHARPGGVDWNTLLSPSSAALGLHYTLPEQFNEPLFLLSVVRKGQCMRMNEVSCC